jgi:hypothetical protein
MKHRAILPGAPANQTTPPPSTGSALRPEARGVGPVVLAVAHSLLKAWVRDGSAPA